MSASSRPITSPLREGFTTGTAASAAASAAFALLLGDSAQSVRSVPVPPAIVSADVSGYMPSIVHGNQGSAQAQVSSPHLRVPIAGCERIDANTATAWVIKDGGDDPDATHGASIHATIELLSANSSNNDAPPSAAPRLSSPHHPLVVELYAGEGVGKVTLPGLPVAVGEPAINPAPRRQIYAALTEVGHGYHGCVRLTLSIPGGEDLARRTLNYRLGIVGGLSILGTHGTVRPYSHDAWAASIVEALHVARATGCDEIMLSTGRRSEKLLQNLYPHLPRTAFVQAADFVEFSLSNAAALGFSRLTWGCFFGKLAKLAQGLPYTHAHEAPLDLVALADWCQQAGLPAPQATLIRQCITANQGLDIILSQPNASEVLHALTLRAQLVAESFSRARLTKLPIQHTKTSPEIRLHLFHLNGQELARA